MTPTIAVIGSSVMRRMCAWVLIGAVLALAAGCGPLRRLGYGGFFRDSWQQPNRVIESLALTPGSRVADLGAGGGYFTWHLAAAVGESGRVYAVDVDADMTSHIEEESREEKQRKSSPDEPGRQHIAGNRHQTSPEIHGRSGPNSKPGRNGSKTSPPFLRVSMALRICSWRSLPMG